MGESHSLLTVSEFASALNIKASTVRAWVLRRKVAYHKIGRLIRIDSTEVSKLLKAGAVPAREVR